MPEAPHHSGRPGLDKNLRSDMRQSLFYKEEKKKKRKKGKGREKGQFHKYIDKALICVYS